MALRDDTELIIDGLFSEGVIAYQRSLGHAVGDVVAALLLSQFWYWSKRQPEERKGWFYMTREQIFEETAMTRREQETARKRLKNLGVLNEQRRGVPARVWYRIDRHAVINLLRQHTKSQLVQNVPTRKADTLQLDSTDRANKAAGKRPAISKTSLKTSQETSAAEDTSAAVLVEKLVSQDVNRADAVRLVRQKQAECVRQLEFMAHLVQTRFRFRNGKGAYLRKAIEDGYAPPAGYVEAMAAKARRSEQEEVKTTRMAQHSTKQRCLRETLARLETDAPEAFSGFIAYVESQKLAAISKPILDKAPEVRERLIDSFKSDDVRLALLEEFLKQNTDKIPDSQPWLVSRSHTAR